MIITEFVIDDHFRRFGDDANVGIAYIYCNFRPQAEQTVKHMLLDFVKQLARQRRQSPEQVESRFRGHLPRNTRPQLDEKYL